MRILALPRLEARDGGTALVVLGACVGTGLAAGLSPLVGIAVAVGVAFLMVILADLTWGLVAFVLVSFFDVIRFQGGSLTFTKLAGLALCGSWLATIATEHQWVRNDFFARHPRFVMLLGLFLGWVSLSAVWAEETGPVFTSVQRYGLNMLLLPIVYSAVRLRRHVTWMLSAFVVGALATAAYGLVFPSPSDPFDTSRLGGAIGEANQTAAVLVSAVVLSFALLGVVRRSIVLSAATVLAALLALAGLVNTLSRAGIVSLAVSLLAACVLGGRWRRYPIALTLLAVATTTSVLSIAPAFGRSRIFTTSSTGRTDLWKVAWRAVQDHPIRGLGAGNFPVSSVHYLVEPGATTRADFIITTPKVVHNIYLDQLANLGAVGFVLFVAILIVSLRCCFSAAKRFEAQGDATLEIASRAVMVALIGLLAADFFSSEQYSKQLWTLLAMGPALRALGERRSPT